MPNVMVTLPNIGGFFASCVSSEPRAAGFRPAS